MAVTYVNKAATAWTSATQSPVINTCQAGCSVSYPGRFWNDHGTPSADQDNGRIDVLSGALVLTGQA